MEGYDRGVGMWYGRTYADAPEIDGSLFFTTDGEEPQPGQFVRVRVTECADCDLVGKAESIPAEGGIDESTK